MEDSNYFKLFYYVITCYGRWGRSIDLDEARKNACVKLGQTEHSIYTLILKGDCSDADVKRLGYMFGVNSWGQVVECIDLNAEDKAFLNEKFVGWSTCECLTNKQKKEQEKKAKKQLATA
jgi:hypothetical protein